METRNLISKIAVVFLSLYVLALICLSIYQHRQVRRLSRGVNPETTITEGSSYDTASENNRITQNQILAGTTFATAGKEPDNIDDIEKQLKETEEDLLEANTKLSHELSRDKELIKLEEEYLKKSNVDNFKVSLSSEYGPLFKELNLPPEKLAGFKQLLIDKQRESREFRVEIVNGIKITQMNENKAKTIEYEAKISELLGRGDYEKYRAYEENGRQVMIRGSEE
jgi:hypothetical protein